MRSPVALPSGRSRLAASLMLAAGSLSAHAQLVPYRGLDRVAAPSVATASAALAAESDWLRDAALLGPIHTVDMESLTPGASGTSHLVAPGVTIRVRNGTRPDKLVVENAPSSYGPTKGFNSTSGGTNHLRYANGDIGWPPQITFTFSKPICAFSLFITGEGHSGLIGDYGSTRFLLDGSIHPAMFLGDGGYPYWPTHDQHNVRFGGLIDPTDSITSVTIALRFLSSDTAWHSSFSIDDVRWVEAPVPAPGALSVLGLPLLAIRRRPRTRMP